ncbi:MAG: hypothetical protein FJ102_16505, partial [Deltaproteobacteria bacterium]|nr:hypothetical protein [Deltaproteobacteria bacterium]
PSLTSATSSPSRLEISVGITHGSAVVSVPADFAAERTAALLSGSSDVLSWEDTLQVLWADFLSDARGAGITGTNGTESWWGYLIGCWNIDPDPDQYLFFRDYGGAPYAMLAYTFSMLRTYSPWIRDRATGSHEGDGFGQAIREFLTAPEAASHSRHHDERGHAGQPWWHWVHAVSEDPDYTNTFPDLGACNTDLLLDDDTGSSIPETGDENEFELEWTTASDGVHYLRYTERMIAKRALTWSLDSQEYDHIIHHARTLAGYGRWCDVLMFYAWLAVEYCLEAATLEECWQRVETHLRPAWALGRSVLRRVLALARLHAHEMGHSWNAHGHCSYDDLDVSSAPGKFYFMEAALAPFTCRVIAHLGLPTGAECVPSEGATERNPSCTRNGFEATSGVESGSPLNFCHVHDMGIPGSSYTHCSSFWCADSEVGDCIARAMGTMSAPVAAIDRDCSAIRGCQNLGEPEQCCCDPAGSDREGPR